MFTGRLLKLQQALKKNKLDTLLVSSPPNIIYLTGFSGFSKDEREAYLIFVAQPQGLTHGYLLTDGRYFEEIKKVVRNFEVVEISSLNPLNTELKKIIKKEKIKRLGFEKDNLTVGEIQKLAARGGTKFSQFAFCTTFKKLRTSTAEQENFRADLSAVLVPTENIVETLRVIKEPQEITAIEKACALGDKAFNYILTRIKPGISEKQLAFELEFFIKKNGADISFPPIVAFGKNSAVPHHVSTHNSELLTHNSIILLDFGVKLNNYCSDMTRVVFLGKASPKQRKIYKTVLDAQKKALEYLGTLTSEESWLRKSSTVRLRPNRLSLPPSEVDSIARTHIINDGYPPIPHGLGHGVGLEVHEKPRLSPKSADILKPGMVFSLEPGIYLTGEFGIRIEDLVLLTETGPKILTRSPKEIIEL